MRDVRLDGSSDAREREAYLAREAEPFIAAALAGLSGCPILLTESVGVIADRAIAIGEAVAAKLAAKREARELARKREREAADAAALDAPGAVRDADASPSTAADGAEDTPPDLAPRDAEALAEAAEPLTPKPAKPTRPKPNRSA